jgi:hypothetical protein
MEVENFEGDVAVIIMGLLRLKTDKVSFPYL